MIFIIAILGTVAIYFGFTNRAFARSHALEEMIQTNVIMVDLKNGVLSDLAQFAVSSAENACEMADDKQLCKSDTLSAVLDGFYGLPLSFALGQKEVVLSCLPAQTKIDINWLNETKDQNRSHFLHNQIERFLQEEYRLYASWQFFELASFLFDKRFGYLENDERLATPSLPKGAIRSIRDLKKIAHDYEILTGDSAIKTIPFDEIFSFETKRNQLNFDYLDKNSCFIAFGKNSAVCDLVGKKATKEDVLAISSEAEMVIKNMKIDFGYNPILDCRVSFRKDNISNSYGFVFDINSKNLANFTIVH